MANQVNIQKDIPSDLTRLTWDELNHIMWEVMEEAYQQTSTVREEIGRRILEEKGQRDLKKAS